jgi:hypothetical protein
MTKWRQGKIIRWIRQLTTAQGTSEENGSGTEPGARTVIKSEYSPPPNDQRDDKTKNAHERMRTAFAGLAIIISFFACRAAQQSATLAEKTVDNARITANAARANVATAKAALDASIERDRRDQRAWVGAVRPLAPELKTGVKTHFGITLMNTGKTPARKAISYVVARSVKEGESLTISYPNPPPQKSVTILSPQMPMTTYDPNMTRTFTHDEVEDIKNKRVTVYLFGKVSYEDVSKQAHCLTFCYWLSSDLRLGHVCEIYNEETDAVCED